MWVIEDVVLLEIVGHKFSSESFLQAADTEEMTRAVWFVDELFVARSRPDLLPYLSFHGVPFAEAVPTGVDIAAATPCAHIPLAEVSRTAGLLN
jgi:hypothetical protein